ncbi:hypothetical protein [Sphingomonas sp. PAMC 26617]|uniref:hypothetical protein n=1 Tax=Sphingomonas sp. PAMC 26617 TaxID=1112216 RepID=UPI0012F4C033|nr:hypothetical protein [Sphingomonas sp. PAMC 26617]
MLDRIEERLPRQSLCTIKVLQVNLPCSGPPCGKPSWSWRALMRLASSNIAAALA